MLKLYRKIAILEAISYLILLFIAMPLKYLFHIPQPVKIFGWIHGALFIFFILVLMLTTIRLKWGILRFLGFFLASLIPFVPFVLEKKLKQEYGK